MIEISLNIIHLIAIGAIINGVLYSIILLYKKENKSANQFLSLLIFSLCCTLAIPILIHLQFFDKYTWLNIFPFWLILWTGPAFYFYCRSLTNPKFVFKKKHLWHFSFIILNYLPMIFSAFIKEWDTYPIILFLGNIGLFAIITILIYTFMAYRVIIRYQKIIFNNLSTVENIQLIWIKQIIYVLLISFILILIFVLYYYNIKSSSPHIYIEIIPVIIISLTTYWLSLKGYMQTQTILVYEESNATKSIESKDYSGIIKKIIDGMIENKLYQNPDLTLSLLSEHVLISEREISNAINQHLNKNFYTFINEFRVEDVKEKIENINNENIKILNLAFDSGFNSKPTFNRIFKEYTGNPPSFYRPKSR